jgi:hypothetical protein
MKTKIIITGELTEDLMASLATLQEIHAVEVEIITAQPHHGIIVLDQEPDTSLTENTKLDFPTVNGKNLLVFNYESFTNNQPKKGRRGRKRREEKFF